jgi:hypothetical protein
MLVKEVDASLEKDTAKILAQNDVRVAWTGFSTDILSAQIPTGWCEDRRLDGGGKSERLTVRRHFARLGVCQAKLEGDDLIHPCRDAQVTTSLASRKGQPCAREQSSVMDVGR